MLSHDALPAPAGNPRTSRVWRRYAAGVALCSLTAASFGATALPAAAAPATQTAVTTAVTGIGVEPVRIQAEDYSTDNGGGLKKESSTDATGQSLGNVGGTWPGGEIVCAGMITFPLRSHLTSAEVWVSVLPAHQRRGHGSAMLARLAAAAAAPAAATCPAMPASCCWTA